MTNIPTIPVHLDVMPLEIEIDPLEIKPLTLTVNANVHLDPIKLTIDPLDIKLEPIEIRPLDLSIRIKEIPSVRVSLPMDYKICFRLCGAELGSIRLCGQGQVITEPYVPNPCECRPLRQGIAAAADAPALPDGQAVPAGQAA